MNIQTSSFIINSSTIYNNNKNNNSHNNNKCTLCTIKTNNMIKSLVLNKEVKKPKAKKQRKKT